MKIYQLIRKDTGEIIETLNKETMENYKRIYTDFNIKVEVKELKFEDSEMGKKYEELSLQNVKKCYNII